MKKKKAIKRNPRHGKRALGHVPHPLAIQAANAFEAIRQFSIRLGYEEDKPYHETLRLFIRQEVNDYVAASLKLAGGEGNPFPEISCALEKIKNGYRSRKTGRIILMFMAMRQRDGQPPTCKGLCHALYGSNWTKSQEAFVWKVCRRNGPTLKRVS